MEKFIQKDNYNRSKNFNCTFLSFGGDISSYKYISVNHAFEF